MIEQAGIMTVTVSALNNYIKRVIDNNTYLREICVKGEISNLKIHSSGHIYMTMKDSGSVLKAVMFKGAARLLRFKVENGMKIIARGRVSVYERDGQYQLYIDEIVPDGIGALYVAFEKLKAQLSEEGLFDEKYKKPLPQYPENIGVITAATGAAVRDIIHVLKRRYPIANVRIFPVAVQGSEAAGEISEAIDFFNTHKLADVLIVGRGGGGVEDLWAFNEECVARAIFKSVIPVISAVGHEIDFTISDFVADRRAPTPSAAAEIAVQSITELTERILSYKSDMLMMINSIIDRKGRALELARNSHAFTFFQNTLKDKSIYIDTLSASLSSNISVLIKSKKEALILNAEKLDALSPLKVMKRGYSIVTDMQGTVIRSKLDMKKDDELKIKMTDGDVTCKIL